MAQRRNGKQKVIKRQDISLSLRVLGYKEETEWVAHCLEMDIRGHGKSFKEAFVELNDLVRMQVEFAVQRKELGLLHHPAHPKYFEIFEKVLWNTLEHFPKPFEAQKTHPIRNIPIFPPSTTPRFVSHAQAT